MSATHWLDGYAVVGTLTKPWALRGEIKVIAESQHLERYCSLGFFHLGNPKTETITPIPNAQLRPHQREFLIQLEGVESPESAAEFRGQLLLIRESQRVELPEGEFYFSDLEGLDVLSQEGEKVGRVIRVEEHPSVNSFLLEIGTTQLYAPWIDDCILKIDLEKKNIEVNLAFLQELLEEGPPEGDRS